jgi:hypothetical protein
LLPADYAHGDLVAEPFRSPRGKPRADPIIAAQGVSAGKNEASGRDGLHYSIVLGAV